MTPELPRAPIRLPWAARAAILLISFASDSRMSSTADWRVKSMLVPVSPSGTGKTVSRLTSSWLAVSQLRLPSRARLKSRPSTSSGLSAGFGSGAGRVFMHPLHEYVHLADPDSQQAFDPQPD